MVTYDYYGSTYLGEVICQEDWEALGLRARELLGWISDRCTLTPRQPQAEAMAICALAEFIHRHEPEGLVQKTAGEVSVRYENRPGYLYAAAQVISPYFRIYRGVGA